MQMGGVPNYASTFGWSDVAFLKRFLSLADFTDLGDVRSLDQGPWALEGFVPTDQTMVRWRCVCLQFRVASGYWIDTHDFRVSDRGLTIRQGLENPVTSRDYIATWPTDGLGVDVAF